MQTGQREDIVAEIERRRLELNLGLLRIYNVYRIFVGLALIATYEQTFMETRLGSYDSQLFWITTLAYTGTNLILPIGLRWIHRQITSDRTLNLALVCIDVVALTLLMFASGGITSGIAPLILITVATGAILVTGRTATFIAAVASVAVLYEEFYLGLLGSNEADFFQAGVYGIIYFTSSLVIQRISGRIRTNEIQTLTQASELADLERLNRQIIQRMRTGIIVVDPDNRVRMHNQSARALLGTRVEEPLITLPTPLQRVIKNWRGNINHRVPPLRIEDHTPEIRVNFSAVRSQDATGDVTIFIEDTSEVQQQAQQLKLAELGRLSASIAHEVRNPLGAISHTAQLLNESDAMLPADQRLTDIIINHCKRMNGVVENVLEMSRRKHPEPQVINLSDNIQQFILQSTESFPDAEFSVDIGPADTLVRVDPAHLVQALTNLVDNALRYSELNDQGQKVRFEGGIEQGSERPYLNVIDYGVGVQEDQVSLLFQPFSTTAVGGTGLGLYITKELCDANQAQISYSPHASGGGCFRILFSHPDRIAF
ncbi:MAG: PAS domain-containing protein [Pseudomonadales bacterium]|nr:PAS domain-containing protein [Pseudomonadales bacterium]